MDFKKHLVLAWELTIKFIVPLMLMALVMFLVSILTLGLLGPVTMAGFMYAVLLLVREGRESKIGDLSRS